MGTGEHGYAIGDPSGASERDGEQDEARGTWSKQATVLADMDAVRRFQDLLRAREAERMRQQEWEELHGVKGRPQSEQQRILVKSAPNANIRPRRPVEPKLDPFQLSSVFGSDEDMPSVDNRNRSKSRNQ